jgi:hypothetical protein
LNNQKVLLRAIHLPAAVPQVRDSLYRWIDAVAGHGKLVLMERELIEPELFLGVEQGAVERFAKAIAGTMRRCFFDESKCQDNFLLTINRR